MYINIKKARKSSRSIGNIYLNDRNIDEEYFYGNNLDSVLSRKARTLEDFLEESGHARVRQIAVNPIVRIL